MTLPDLPVADFQAFLVCLARMAALVAALPVLSGGQMPGQIKAGLAVMLSLLIFPVVQEQLPEIDFAPVPFGLFMVREVLLGVMLGFMARLVFTAAEFGGTVIGYKMGFAAANVFDPQNQRQISLMAQFFNVFAILVFLAADVHHLILRVLVSSYWQLPPGQATFGGSGVRMIMELTARMFDLAIKFSAPVLAVLILALFALGILARVFPQMNVFLLSFPINIGVAFLLIGLSLNLMAALLVSEFERLGNYMQEMLQRL